MANKNMLACLEMELEAEGLTYKKASDFQGLYGETRCMENICWS